MTRALIDVTYMLVSPRCSALVADNRGQFPTATSKSSVHAPQVPPPSARALLDTFTSRVA